MNDVCRVSQRGEITHHVFIAFFQIPVIHLFRFGDHGVHDVGLPAEFQFFLDEFVDL